MITVKIWVWSILDDGAIGLKITNWVIIEFDEMISSPFISSLREWSPMKEHKNENEEKTENKEVEVIQKPISNPSTPIKRNQDKNNEVATSPMVNQIMESPLMKLKIPVVEIDKQSVKPTDIIDVFNIIWKDQQRINLVKALYLTLR